MDDVWTTFGLASLVTVLLLVFLQQLLWQRRFRASPSGQCKKPLPPGSMGLPWIGETLHFFYSAQNFVSDRMAKYGNIYKTHLLGRPTISVAGADLIKTLISMEPRCLEASWHTTAREILGVHNLLITTGEEHARLRKILLTVFQPSRLAEYFPCVQDRVRTHLLSWCLPSPVVASRCCEGLMTDVVMDVLFGLRKETARRRQVREAVTVVNRNTFSLPIRFPGGGFKKAIDGRDVIRDFVHARLNSTTDKDHLCILDVLMAYQDTDKRLTDQQLVDNLIGFFIAATGTTFSALCSCLLALGNHPEVLVKLRDELSEHGLLTKDTEGELTYDILQNLTYVRCVEREVLRLYEPAAGVFRKANMDIEIEDVLLPKDWIVNYCIRETHRSTPVFDNDQEFRPERWLDPDLDRKLRSGDSCSYMPFGFGRRNCVGKPLARMVIHTFLVELARLVDFQLQNPDPEIVTSPVPLPRDGLPVSFRPRN